MSRPESTPDRPGERLFRSQIQERQRRLRATRGIDLGLAILAGILAGLIAGVLLGCLLTREFFEPIAASWNPVGGAIGFAAGALQAPRVYMYLRSRRARRYWTG